MAHNWCRFDWATSQNKPGELTKINDELCKLSGIKCNITSAYHPQSNGLDERFNQTLQRQLLKFVDSEPEQWDLYLDAILFSYRVSQQESTKYSPFFLVYGRQARLPVEFNTKPNNEDQDECDDEIEKNDAEVKSMEENMAKMVDIRKKALANIGIAQQQQKIYYDAKHCKDKEKYDVGALVLLKNSRKLSCKGSKMEPNWTGPYSIVEVAGKNTYRLCRYKGTKKEKVLKQLINVTRLKLYHTTSGNGGPQRDDDDDEEEDDEEEDDDDNDGNHKGSNKNAVESSHDDGKKKSTGRKRVKTGAEKKWSIKHAKKRKIDSEAIHEVIELLTEEDSDNEIQSTTKWKQIDDMWLTKEDRQILQTNDKWLTDNIVNAGQILLKQKYGIPGLQSVTLGNTFSFDIVGGCEFVQILFSANCHWIAVSTIGCPYSHVRVYDSLYYDMPKSTKEQICALLATSQPVIGLDFVNVQHQTNSSDCGLFALAFCTSLCAGEDPGQLHFNCSQMRHHLLQCLEYGEMKPFPSLPKSRKLTSVKKDKIEVFCTCRTQEGGKMLECLGCTEWFHEECLLGVPQEAWDEPHFKWLCDKCNSDKCNKEMIEGNGSESEKENQKEGEDLGPEENIGMSKKEEESDSKEALNVIEKEVKEILEQTDKCHKKQKFPSFTKKMRELLNIGDELSCEHIDLVQKIIAAQFPTVHGLQNPLNLSTIDGSHYKCLQIHSLDGARWIASSCHEKVVTVYNSCNFGPLTMLEKQLALVYSSAVDTEESFPELSVHLPTVQKQKSYNDSGVFAIAFSVHFALGNADEIEHIIFERSQMRNHLRKCLHHKKFEPFPHKRVTSIPRDQAARASFPFWQILLCCLCLKPCELHECSYCGNTCHCHCGNLKQLNEDKWVCSKCL